VFPAFGRALAILHAADGQSEVAIDFSHPFGVAGGEVVVDRDHVDALAAEGIEVGRQGGHQRFPFPGGHFGNLSPVENNAPDELDVVGNHFPENFLAPDGDDSFFVGEAAAGIFDDGKGFREDVVQGLARVEAVAEFPGFGLEGLFAESLEIVLDLVNALDQRPNRPDGAGILGPDHFLDEPIEHSAKH
jgi:hypothetical protein